MSNINDIIEKVKKLHRLAACESATPDEAALAAARAQEIIDRYKLKMDDLGDDETVDDEKASLDDLPLDEFVHNWLVTPWTVRLGNFICFTNQCRLITYTRRQINGKTYPIRTLKIVGHPSDVMLVRYLYGYLKGEVLRLDSNCPVKDGKWRRAYCIGIVDTICMKIREQGYATKNQAKQSVVNNERGLIRLNSALARLEQRESSVELFIKDSMKTKKSRTGDCQTDSDLDNARRLGQIAGENIRMTRAVASLGNA